ncbi:MAG: hypothetical protein RLZZ415_493, partial [Pseudomonadota bacterium]
MEEAGPPAAEAEITPPQRWRKAGRWLVAAVLGLVVLAGLLVA